MVNGTSLIPLIYNSIVGIYQKSELNSLSQ